MWVYLYSLKYIWLLNKYKYKKVGILWIDFVSFWLKDRKRIVEEGGIRGE